MKQLSLTYPGPLTLEFSVAVPFVTAHCFDSLLMLFPSLPYLGFFWSLFFPLCQLQALPRAQPLFFPSFLSLLLFEEHSLSCRLSHLLYVVCHLSSRLHSSSCPACPGSLLGMSVRSEPGISDPQFTKLSSLPCLLSASPSNSLSLVIHYF